MSVSAFDCYRQEFAAIEILHQDYAEHGGGIDDMVAQTGNSYFKNRLAIKRLAAVKGAANLKICKTVDSFFINGV